MTKRIIAAQEVPEKHHRNVRKQASQIRYCLTQAHEYFRAAASVTIATRPNLLYYGLMSLALAEILFKQSGLSSLDKTREENRHHGLSMTVGTMPGDQPLEIAGAALRAKPVVVGGRRRGTFELWHRSSREHPIIGVRTIQLESGGSTSGPAVIFGAWDKPYEAYPENGITLADALASIPLLAEHLRPTGLNSTLIRGSATAQHRDQLQWNSTAQLLLHPNVLNKLVVDQLCFDANAVDRIECIEIGDGFAINLNFDWLNPSLRHSDRSSAPPPFPPAAPITTNEFRMWTNRPELNEFGYFYVALYLAGNYARYYPDKWLHDVAQSSPLAMAIEELCDIATWRVPWLSLCELDLIMYVPEV